MKKLIAFTICLVMLSKVNGQHFEIGLKAGVNTGISDLGDLNAATVKSAAQTNTVQAGAYGQIRLWAVGVYLQPELLLNGRASNFEINNSTGNFTVKQNSIYLDVPILVGMQFAKVLRVYAGPNYQTLLNQNTEIPNTAAALNYKATELSKNHVGIIFGAGVNVLKLRFDVRYDYSNNLGSFMTDPNGNAAALKNSLITVQVGYKLYGVF